MGKKLAFIEKHKISWSYRGYLCVREKCAADSSKYHLTSSSPCKWGNKPWQLFCVNVSTFVGYKPIQAVLFFSYADGLQTFTFKFSNMAFAITTDTNNHRKFAYSALNVQQTEEPFANKLHKPCCTVCNYGISTNALGNRAKAC